MITDVMHDLGLEYVEDTRDYNVLRTQIYEYYGAADILGIKEPVPRTTSYNFPKPLYFVDGQTEIAGNVHCEPDPQCLADIERFFKHMLHTDAGALLPHIEATLAAEHKNSPVFAANTIFDIDRESFAQLVDRAYRLAAAHGATSSQNSRALTNALMLTELLVWRR